MHFDPAVLSGTLAPLVTRLAERHRLTPAERLEIIRIAQGFACKDSATDANISPETVRARRKRIYRKLGTGGGANEVIAMLLALSLRTLAGASDADAAAPDQPSLASPEPSAATV